MSGLWEIFWFFLPAGVANMAPVFANKIPLLNRWNTPLDFGKTYKGKRIFGDHKTWRGVIFGTLAAGLFGLFQYRVIASSPESTGFIFTATAAMGLGALIGDAVKSFFKRRRGIASGQSWFPYDQTDYIFGGIVFVYPFIQLPAWMMLMILIIYGTLHVIVSYAGYLLKLKDKAI